MTRRISRWSGTRGATFRRYIAFRIPGTSPAEYLELDGYGFDMQIRAKEGATTTAEATATITVTEEDITTSVGVTIPAGRAALVEIPSSATATMKPGKHYFNILRTDPDDAIEDVAGGEFYLYAGVTIIA